MLGIRLVKTPSAASYNFMIPSIAALGVFTNRKRFSVNHGIRLVKTPSAASNNFMIPSIAALGVFHQAQTVLCKSWHTLGENTKRGARRYENQKVSLIFKYY